MSKKERAFRKGAQTMQAQLATWFAAAGQPDVSRAVAAMDLPPYYSRRDQRIAALVRAQSQPSQPSTSTTPATRP